MKDIVITGRRIRIELRIFFSLWLLANIINAYAIWRYDSSWIELITYQLMVLFLSAIFYCAVSILRIVIFLLGMAYRRYKS